MTDLRGEGFSIREIARIVEISKTRVVQILKNIKSNYARHQNKSHQSVNDQFIDVQAVLQMRSEGKSIRVISGILGLPKTRVWRILKKHEPVHN